LIRTLGRVTVRVGRSDSLIHSNPIVLERIRGLAGDAAGWSASQLGLLHFATSTDADQGYAHNRIPDQCRETAGAIGLLREAVATLEIDVDRLNRSSGRHWSTASALADDLVRTHGMSFRAAHETVARFIAAHEAAGESGHTVRPDLAGEPLRGYSPQGLTEILDARTFVESRCSVGGTSAARRSELSAEAADDIRKHQQAVASLTDSVEQARARLLRDAASPTEDESARRRPSPGRTTGPASGPVRPAVP
jgi:argininosuccinate lyase